MPSGAAAAPLGLTDCGDREGVHQCSGIVPTWDGVPLDTTVTLPREGAAGLPLVVTIHGFGNSKHEYLDPAQTAYTDNVYAWARAGYAVLSFTARGLWGSCGQPEARAARPDACARGYLHLADVRYEGRDTQELAGRLVDEGVADPRRIGVTGDSYGGGQSLMLAALRDRVMLPDGTLVPWRSPNGTPLAIAGAAVVIPWTDLIYAIAPNGSTLTYAIAPPDASASPVGVVKSSVSTAVFAAAQNAIGPGQPVGEPFVPGRPMGYLAPPGVDPEADVATWVARSNAGPPYTDPQARSIVETLTRFHSPFHIDATTAPAPLFIAGGFTDDLFPVDEVTRFANRMRRDHPGVPLSLLLADFGHQRASNKPADRALLLERVHGWLDQHVRGDGAPQPLGVTAFTQTCPRDAPSGGPFTAPVFEALARGEVRFSAEGGTVMPDGGDASVGAAIDPATGGGERVRHDAVAGRAGHGLVPVARERRLDAPRRADGHREAAACRASRTPRSSPRGCGTSRRTGRRSSSPAGCTGRRGRGRRSSSCTRTATASRPATSRGWSWSATTRRTRGAATADFRVDVERLELRLPVREHPDGGSVAARAPFVLPPGQQLAPGVRAKALRRTRVRWRCAKRRARRGARAPRPTMFCEPAIAVPSSSSSTGTVAEPVSSLARLRPAVWLNGLSGRIVRP